MRTSPAAATVALAAVIAMVAASPAISGARSGVERTFSLHLTPPGAVRGARYQGTIESAPDERGTFLRGDSIRVVALRSESIAGIAISRRSPTELAIACDVGLDAVPGEALFVTIERGDTTFVGSAILRTVAPSWNPAWRPIAVAPPDTAVGDSTQTIVLDASHSRHGAGLDAMHFRWSIDGDRRVIKGATVTTTTLPPGRHAIVLVAGDYFGWVSTDTMVVLVR